MIPENAPWRKGALFICDKCGKRDDGDSALKGLADDWKKDFKSDLRDAGLGKEIRVVVSGCLALCPPKKQVLAYCPAEGKTEMYVVTANEKKAIYDMIKARAEKK